MVQLRLLSELWVNYGTSMAAFGVSIRFSSPGPMLANLSDWVIACCSSALNSCWQLLLLLSLLLLLLTVAIVVVVVVAVAALLLSFLQRKKVPVWDVKAFCYLQLGYFRWLSNNKPSSKHANETNWLKLRRFFTLPRSRSKIEIVEWTA